LWTVTHLLPLLRDCCACVCVCVCLLAAMSFAYVFDARISVGFQE
jgi:hypothetical protein